MERMSPESIAMQVIGNMWTTMLLDKSAVAPYNLTTWADHLKPKLEDDTADLAALGVNSAPFIAKVDEFREQAQSVWDLMEASTDADMADVAREVNALILEAVYPLCERMTQTGGDVPYSSWYPYQNYLRDALALKRTLEALEQVDVATALHRLVGDEYHSPEPGVTYAYFSSKLSEVVAKAWSVDYVPFGVFSEGKMMVYTDVWDEIDSLRKKQPARDNCFQAEIQSLTIQYRAAVNNLRYGLKTIKKSFKEAENSLKAAENYLTKGHGKKGHGKK